MFSFFRRMEPSRRRLLLTCFYAFFCSGLVSLMLGSAMPDLKRSWGLSDAFSGVLLSAHSAGNLAAGFVSGLVPFWLGRRRSIMLLSSMAFLGMAVMAVTGVPGLLFAAFMLTGFGRGSVTSGDLAFMKEHPQELVRELYAKMTYQQLRPRVLVSYTREPFIYPAGNVRVTFDSDIRTSLFRREFLTGEAAGISATDEPQDIYLEVKFDAFLPEVVQDLIQVKGIRQHAFSKYSASRRYG